MSALSPTGSLGFWRIGDRGSVCRQVPGLHGNAAWCACRHAPYGSAQGMGGGAFGHACGTDGGVDGLLDTAGVEVMPLDDKGTGLQSGRGRGSRTAIPRKELLWGMCAPALAAWRPERQGEPHKGGGPPSRWARRRWRNRSSSGRKVMRSRLDLVSRTVMREFSTSRSWIRRRSASSNRSPLP